MARMILRGDAVLVRDQAKERGARWLVKIHGVTVMVVASRMTGHIITVLPPGSVPREKRGARTSGEEAKRAHRDIRRQASKGWRGSGRGKRSPRPRLKEDPRNSE